jgi:adenine-specific DNA methylase
MPHTKLLIEQWLPIAPIGAECMRERGASSALPPLYFLHVWWARRPLTVSRAAILASLLPAYPEGNDPSVQPWPDKFRRKFPNFDDYKQWFIKLIGILGDPVKGRKLIQWANDQGIKLKVHPYGYPRAFTTNPSQDQLEELYDLLEWTWGTRDIAFSDPMAGGGSIPFEALRYGLTVHANELNPVASVILKATLDYPARFGLSLVADIRKYGELWAKKVRERLEQFFPLADPADNVFCYVWARTVPCPITGKPVPLSPNWWLRKGGEPVAVRVVAEDGMQRCRFEIVRGATACSKLNPDKGTIKGGGAVSCWRKGEPIPGKIIKDVAQRGQMGEQLVAVGIKRSGKVDFRAVTQADDAALSAAEQALAKCWNGWLNEGLFPTEEIDTVSNYDRGHRLYGAFRWADFFSPRQKLAIGTMVEVYRQVSQAIGKEIQDTARSGAIRTYLGFCIDKSVDYNCRFTRLHVGRDVITNKFDKHNYAFKWSYAEFDASRNLGTWAVDQVADAYSGIANLAATAGASLFGGGAIQPAIERLTLTTGPAQQLPVKPGSLKLILVDPPYYRNVMYAEC